MVFRDCAARSLPDMAGFVRRVVEGASGRFFLWSDVAAEAAKVLQLGVRLAGLSAVRLRQARTINSDQVA